MRTRRSAQARAKVHRPVQWRWLRAPNEPFVRCRSKTSVVGQGRLAQLTRGVEAEVRKDLAANIEQKKGPIAQREAKAGGDEPVLNAAPKAASAMPAPARRCSNENETEPLGNESMGVAI